MDRPEVWPKACEDATRKSFWRNRYSHIWSFICPICHTQRRMPFRPQPGGFRHYAQIGLTAIMVMLITWPWFTWKGIVAFFPIWSVFEAVYRYRVRSKLGCTTCGFDPYLFLIDEDWARDEVEAHWRKKFEEKGIPFPEPKPKSKPQHPVRAGLGRNPVKSP